MNTESINRETITAHKRRICLAMIHFKGGIGLNYEEIAIRSGVPADSVGRRLCELERDGVIEKTGKRRKTSRGIPANCYKIVEK